MLSNSQLEKTQTNINRMNQLAEDLLCYMHPQGKSNANTQDAERLLAEFMRLMGYLVE